MMIGERSSSSDLLYLSHNSSVSERLTTVTDNYMGIGMICVAGNIFRGFGFANLNRWCDQ